MEATSTAENATIDVKEKRVPYLPPCRVCEGVASGFHYGVNTCEACKGFYRRSVARQKPYPTCTSDGVCNIQMENRNSCAACRFNKCMEVGMSKQAIKTGRYTHEKRTLDTLEIKQMSASSSPISPPDTGSPESPSQRSALPTSPLIYGENIVSLSNEICQAFRKSFMDATYIWEHTEEVREKVMQILRERGISKVNRVIYIPGPGASRDKDQQHLSNFVQQFEEIHRVGQSYGKLTGDNLLKVPEYNILATKLFEAWLHRIDQLIRLFVHFVRTLPQFQTLPVTDQITLIKAARSEVSMLLFFIHYKPEWQSLIDLRHESGTLTLIPKEALLILYFLHEEVPEETDHLHLVQRCLKQMVSLNMHIDNIAVLCTICVFSTDREGLSPEVLPKISQIQDQLSKVLAYILSYTHPTEKCILSKYLMLLPSLRIVNEYNTRKLILARHSLKPEVSSLLQEVLPQSLDAADGGEEVETTPENLQFPKSL